MRKWVLGLVAACLLMSIGSAHALQTADVEMDVSSLGDGWRYEVAAPTGGPLETWAARHTLFGPDGARVLLFVHDIGATINDRGYEWGQLLDRLSIYAGYHAFGLEDDENPGVNDVAGLPDAVEDAVRDEYIDHFGEPLGYGIYAIKDSSLAIMVVVEGTVNELTGVAAADHVAGLYFAALSDQ